MFRDVLSDDTTVQHEAHTAHSTNIGKQLLGLWVRARSVTQNAALEKIICLAEWIFPK
jgi:hypothetical protein